MSARTRRTAGRTAGRTARRTAGLVPQLFDKDVARRVRLPYWLYLPDGYDPKGRPWPLVLFLHGAGERGDDLELLKKHGIPKLIAAGRKFPFVCVAPQCPAEWWWQPHELLALLDDLTASLAVDADRVYGTGMSMGGYGTWATALTEPRRFAAIAPVCGGGNPFLAGRIVRLPVWAFHGAMDEAVPLEESRKMVAALRSRNAREVRLTIYENLPHNCWDAAYDTAELYDWLLSHKRTAK